MGDPALSNKDFPSLPSFQRQASCGFIDFKGFNSLPFCKANLTWIATDLACRPSGVTLVLLHP